MPRVHGASTRAPLATRVYDGAPADVEPDIDPSAWRELSALADLVDRYRILAENATDVVFHLSLGFDVLWISPSVTEMLGWRPDELIGRNIADYLAAEDLGAILRAIDQTPSGEITALEVRVRRADGATRWVHVTGRNASYSGVDGFVGALRDVSEQVAARETLVASESRYRLLAENATDVVLELSDANRLTWVSPSVERMLGWRPEEWVGHDTTEFMHPDDLAAVAEFRRLSLAGQSPPSLEVRYRAKDGSFHWMSGEDHALRDGGGRVVTRIVGLRNVDTERAAHEREAAAEARYRMLAENASEVVMEIARDNTVAWVSPSAATVFGISPEAMVGESSWDRVVEEDRARVVSLRSQVFDGERVEPYQVRARTADGEVRWMTASPHGVRGEDGAVTSVVLTVRDSQVEVLAARATSTLSAGSRALVHATDEHALFGEMCEIATGEGGYALSWYARKVDDDEHTVVALASSARNRAYVERVTVDWSDGPLGQGPSGRAIRTGETVVVRDFLTDDRFAPWREAAREFGFRTSVALPVLVDGRVDGCLMVYASEPDAFDGFAVSVLEDLAAELGIGVQRLRDRQRLLATLRDQQLLTRAIEHADETVLILDPTYAIVYANPAAARSSGYALEEILGRTPHMFRAGPVNEESEAETWSALSTGHSWHGAFLNRRKSGEVYEESAVISPVYGDDGALVAYVEVKNDVTAERRIQGLEADIAQTLDDRTALLSVMGSVRAADTVHATAYLFCEAARQLPGVEVAGILLAREGGDLVPISVVGADLPEVSEERPIETGGPEFLEAVARGTQLLSLDLAQYGQNRDLIGALVAEGLTCLTLAPIRWQGEMVGVLALASREADAVDQMRGRLLYYEEIASYAGSLLGDQAQSYEERSVVRAEILGIIERREFAAVFQPQVDLVTGDLIGYEALTRFADGVAPDARIVEAHAVGLGTELEAALLRAALEGAAAISEGVLLFLNLSPSALLDPATRAPLRGAGRPLVVEVTEGAPISRYADVRRAMRDLPGCRLAVDDAGAGYTSLTKIAQLHPDYVKLDRSLVHRIDRDATLQAMVAGMCHFASQAGTIVVAEGIETEGEARAIRELGAGLAPGHLIGQGFLFGRPGPLP